MENKKSWFSPLLDIFFPKICAACESEKVADSPLCISCLSDLSIIENQADGNHLAELRLQNRFPYQRAFSYLYMSKKGSTHKLLHQIKYKYRKDIAVFLGDLFAEEIQKQFHDQVDAIIAVPIHKKKLKSRGYNQTFILAECVAKKMGIPFYADTLKKVKNTDSQTSKTRIERIANLEGSIQVENAALLSGKRILLIDDVLTTGSTVEACYESIKNIPEIQVSVATLALAGD